MLETRYKEIKEALVSRDREWLNSLQYCKDSLRMTTHEQINLRVVMESICKTQCELTKLNEQLLNWAMKAVSGKNKVPLPQINISDYVPYIIVPPNEKKPKYTLFST